MRNKQKSNRISGIDRLVDLIERFTTIGLYLNTDLDQNTIGKKLSMDIHRVNAILKGLKKPLQKQYNEKAK